MNGQTVSPLKGPTDGTGQVVDSWSWLHPHLVTEDSLTSAALYAHLVSEIYVRQVSLSQVTDWRSCTNVVSSSSRTVVRPGGAGVYPLYS